MCAAGSSQTAAYMTGPRLGGSGTPTFLPSITIAEPACRPYDTYPAPTPLRRSLTTLPWRPSAYYGSSRLEPNVPNVGSMPEPRSDRNKLTELDSLKVIRGNDGVPIRAFQFAFRVDSIRFVMRIDSNRFVL